ncbi:SMP-30/gluconolactonase/LRE family protein, partial [Serratia marcescens]
MFPFRVFSLLVPQRRCAARLAGIALFIGGVVQAHATQRIDFSPDPAGAYPEGVAWNARAGAFLVSSLRGGQLG